MRWQRADKYLPGREQFLHYGDTVGHPNLFLRRRLPSTRGPKYGVSCQVLQRHGIFSVKGCCDETVDLKDHSPDCKAILVERKQCHLVTPRHGERINEFSRPNLNPTVWMGLAKRAGQVAYELGASKPPLMLLPAATTLPAVASSPRVRAACSPARATAPSPEWTVSTTTAYCTG
jgi:hypothetical protein